MNRRRRLLRGPALAVVLTLALTTGVGAADTGTVGETITVPQTLTLVIETDEIDYGSVEPGTQSDARSMTATVSAPADGSWALIVAGTSLEAGDHAMPADVRSIRVGTGDWTALSGDLRVATGRGRETVEMAWRVAVPPAQAPGVYQGSLTFTLRAP